MFDYCMITGGGKGERLMPLTQYVHKGMLTIDGTSIISALIRQIRRKIPHISVTVGHKGNELAKHVIEEQVSSIYNTNRKSECWWLFNTPFKLIDKPVVVFACDLVMDVNLEFIYESYLQIGSPVCMLIPTYPLPGVEGDFITGDGPLVTNLSRSIESDYLASGVFVINPFQINELMSEPEKMQHVWMQLLQMGKLYHSDYYPEKWDTVNTIEQLTAVQQSHKTNHFENGASKQVSPSHTT